MRFNRNRDQSEGETSAASSLQSFDSYEIFGSACSDFSDCEFGEEKKRRTKFIQKLKNTFSSPTSSANSIYVTCSQCAMDKCEKATHTCQKDDENSSLLRNEGPPAYNTLYGSSDTLGYGDISSEAVLSTLKKLESQQKCTSINKKQSSLVTIFSIWNTTLGSSLLTIAWGVERAGLFPALILLIAMGGICLFTAYILIRVNHHHGGEACEVPALCRRLLGRWAEILAHGFSLMVLIGANIIYWILITNFLYFTVNYLIDITSTNSTDTSSVLPCPAGVNGSLIIPPPVEDTSPYWSLHSTVPVYVALLVFPLLNFKNASFFTKFNSLGTLSVLYLLIFVIAKGLGWGINYNNALIVEHAGKDAAVLSGMLALSFYIHNIIITIMNNNERQEKNGRDLTIAFLLITVTYMVVGTVFYMCFPLIKTCIQDNLLNNFEKHDVMTAIARMLLLFQVITVYPLVAYMLRSEALILMPLKPELKDSRLVCIGINCTIVFICILFACFCPNIGTIIRYTGAISGLVHVFALPALLQLRSLYLRHKLNLIKTVLYVSIITIGAVNLIMQFFISE